MNLLQLCLAIVLCLIAFIVSKMGVPVLVKAAFSTQFMDHPENVRKVHDESVPTLGGIVFIASLWLVFSLHPQSTVYDGFGYLLASTIVLFVIAIKDDLFVLAPEKKILAQFAAAAFMIFGAGVYVETFGGVFGIDTIPYAASVAISIAVFIVVTNAVNLIDGVDGLAASVVITCCLFFSFWFFSAGIYPQALFSLFFAGAMAGFLWHNREPASVFMGDTGALLSGFYLAFLGIEFLNTAAVYPVQFAWQTNTPAILVAVLIVPLYDTLRVFILRVAKGRSPFKADAEHIHHQLLNSGLSHSKVTLIMVGLQSFIVASAVILSPFISVNYLLLTVIALSVMVFPTRSIKRKFISTITNKTFEKYNPYREHIQPNIVDRQQSEIHTSSNGKPVKPNVKQK